MREYHGHHRCNHRRHAVHSVVLDEVVVAESASAAVEVAVLPADAELAVAAAPVDAQPIAIHGVVAVVQVVAAPVDVQH
jgi:hypothetical protein